MRREDDALRRAFVGREVPDESRLQATVGASVCAYRVHEARLPLRGWEFLLQQARYVRKRWWLLQGAVLAVLWLVLRTQLRADYVRRCVGVLAPTFGMLALPELWKNRICGALEVECASRFALRQVYAARLLLFGLVDMLWLSLFFAAVSLGARLELGMLILQFMVPLNVTCCICFGTLSCRRFGSEGLALGLCCAWIAAWVLVVLDQGIYERLSVPAWCALLALSALCLLRVAAKLCADSGKIWEESPSWN